MSAKAHQCRRGLTVAEANGHNVTRILRRIFPTVFACHGHAFLLGTSRLFSSGATVFRDQLPVHDAELAEGFQDAGVADADPGRDTAGGETRLLVQARDSLGIGLSRSG